MGTYFGLLRCYVTTTPSCNFVRLWDPVTNMRWFRKLAKIVRRAQSARQLAQYSQLSFDETFAYGVPQYLRPGSEDEMLYNFSESLK